MDLLIDLIIYLIKQATKSNGNGTVAKRQPLPPAAVARQVQAMQRTLAAPSARTRPASAPAGGGRRGPASWAQPNVSAAVPPVNQPPLPPIQSIARADVLKTPAQPRRAIPGLKLPFLLGELLSPPVALRDE